MLVEVKAKVSWKIDDKIKKKAETYIIDVEFFADAEYTVTALLHGYQEEGTVEDFEIQGLKLSSVREIISQYQGEYSFIATLRDTVHLDDGAEKTIKYKVLLWANTIADAMTNVREIISQGYDMQIDSLKEVNYTHLTHVDNGERETTENQLSAGA